MPNFVAVSTCVQTPHTLGAPTALRRNDSRSLKTEGTTPQRRRINTHTRDSVKKEVDRDNSNSKYTISCIKTDVPSTVPRLLMYQQNIADDISHPYILDSSFTDNATMGKRPQDCPPAAARTEDKSLRSDAAQGLQGQDVGGLLPDGAAPSRSSTVLKCVASGILLSSALFAYLDPSSAAKGAVGMMMMAGRLAPAADSHQGQNNNHHGARRRLAATMGDAVPPYVEPLLSDLRARKKLFEDAPPEEIKYWFEYSGPLQVSGHPVELPWGGHTHTHTHSRETRVRARMRHIFEPTSAKSVTGLSVSFLSLTRFVCCSRPRLPDLDRRNTFIAFLNPGPRLTTSRDEMIRA